MTTEQNFDTNSSSGEDPDGGIAEKIAYWTPYAQIIAESIHARGMQKLSQSGLAERMGTKQSVISRFENMGRLPNYDFIARLSQALGHSPGITLFGDFMAVVPLSKQKNIHKIADSRGVTTQQLLQDLLDAVIRQAEIAPIEPTDERSLSMRNWTTTNNPDEWWKDRNSLDSSSTSPDANQTALKCG